MLVLSPVTNWSWKMTVKAVLIAMFSVSQLCGTMPLRIVSSAPFKLAASSCSLVYTMLLFALTIWNSFLTFSMVNDYKKPWVSITSSAPNDSCNCTTTTATPQTSEAQYLIIQSFNPQILIIMSLGAHWVSIFRIEPHLPLFIDYLISIDSKLTILVKGLSLSKTYHFPAFLFFSILALSFVVFGFYIHLHSEIDVRFLWRLTLVAHNFVSLSCELQLLIFILIIKSRFQIVNRALSSMCHNMKAGRKSLMSRKTLYPKIEKHTDLQRIELAHDCYLKLVDCWALLNKIYAVQVMFSTSGCFLKALFNVYFLSSNPFDELSSVQKEMINSATWMAFYFSRFAMLALVATSTSDEFAKTKAITALMSHWYDDSTIKEELDIFWMNTSCRKLTFSTCGLFTLDSGLIVKACVTGITYLVLLVQFKPQIAVN